MFKASIAFVIRLSISVYDSGMVVMDDKLLKGKCLKFDDLGCMAELGCMAG